MLFRINTKTHGIDPFHSGWAPNELDIERYLLSRQGSDGLVLNASVLGEPLLLVSNHVKTRFEKRVE